MNLLVPRLSSRALLLLAGIVLAFLIAGCAEDNGPPGETPAPLTVEEVVARTEAAMSEATTYRFRLTHSSGGTPLGGGLMLDSAEGALAGQERISFTAHAALGRSMINIDTISIGDSAYMTNPITGAWAEMPPGSNPFQDFDPRRLAAEILGDLQEPEFMQPPGQGGDHMVRGRVPAGALSSLVTPENPEELLDVEMAIDRESFTVSRVEIRGRLAEDEPDGTQRVIEFWDYGASINIEPPI